MLFGVAGAVCPVLFLTDPGSPFWQPSEPHPGLAPCVGTFLAHAYLTLAGIRLLLGRRPGLLGYFFALESAYALALIFLLPAATRIGLVGLAEARWTRNVSFGFIAQLCLGFPLWGWLLSRKVITPEGHAHGDQENQ